MFTSEIQINKQKFFLGTFDKCTEAKNAYDKVQKKIGRLPKQKKSILDLLASEASIIGINSTKGLVKVGGGKYRAKIMIDEKYFSLGTFELKVKLS